MLATRLPVVPSLVTDVPVKLYWLIYVRFIPFFYGATISSASTLTTRLFEGRFGISYVPELSLFARLRGRPERIIFSWVVDISYLTL